jgi:hypothetical protein
MLFSLIYVYMGDRFCYEVQWNPEKGKEAEYTHGWD